MTNVFHSNEQGTKSNKKRTNEKLKLNEKFSLNKTLCLIERPGFVSENNIYQRPFVKHGVGQVGSVTRFFELGASNGMGI